MESIIVAFLSLNEFVSHYCLNGRNNYHKYCIENFPYVQEKVSWRSFFFFFIPYNILYQHISSLH